MPISVKCADCGKALKAPDALAGKKAKCPDCGATVPIPKPTVDAEEVYDEPAESYEDESDSPGDDDDSRKPCPMCGEMIASAAAKCRYCGEVFDGRVSKGGRRRKGLAVVYAGFWMRFAAVFIDGILMQIVLFPVSAGINIAFGGNIGGPQPGANPDPKILVAVLLNLVISVVAQWLYFALQESSQKQATVGKRALGIRVTDLNGNRLSFGHATGRHFGKIVSGMICGIGYFMAGFTEKKQALHDSMASTLVVKD